MSQSAPLGGAFKRRPCLATTTGLVVLLLSIAACISEKPIQANVAEVDVTGTEFAFDAPDSLQPGLTRFTFHNVGRTYHHMQLVRLNADIPFEAAQESLPDVEPLPKWMIPVGGVEGADSLGQPVTVTVPLTPGRYLIICRITTPKRETHYSLGMVRPFVVTERSGTSAPSRVAHSQGTIVVRLRDYAFEAPDTLAAGKHTFEVRNMGPSEHHVAVARLAPGATVRDILNAPPGSSVAFSVLGGTAGLAPGEANWLHLELTPGNYVLLCFVEEPSTHKEHLQLGMIRMLTVA